MRGKIRTYQTDRKEDNRTDTWRRIARRISYVSALFICSVLVLCGCTRREQLVLHVNDTVQENGHEASDIEEADVSATQEQERLEIQGAGTSDLQGASDRAGVESDVQMPGVLTGTQGQTATQEQTPAVIYVHVCGAVKNPGVYELDAGSRVYEAVEKAGGFTESADSSYVNQAQRLTDGAKLIIPTVEQVEAMSSADGGERAEIGIVEATGGMQTVDGEAGVAGGTGADDGLSGSNTPGAAASDGKININTASEAELCNIPGIGGTRAAAIVAYRQEMGGFNSTEDIMNVSGIKQGTYDKIKDKIKVN